MTQDFALEFASTMIKLILITSLVGIPASAQQAISTQSSSDAALVSTLPDAPSSQDSQNGVPPTGTGSSQHQFLFGFSGFDWTNASASDEDATDVPR
jgi:hypothetical protein